MEQTPTLKTKDIDKHKIALSCGRLLLLTVLYCYLIAIFSFIVGSDIKVWFFPFSIITAIATEFYFSGKRSIISALIYLCSLVTMLIITSLLDDASSDGIVYHQEIMVHLLNGWNPFYESVAGSPDPDLELLVAHYAKGIEVMASIIAKFTGYINTGMSINLMIIAGTGFIVFWFLDQKFEIDSKWKKLFLTLFFVMNPVGMAQCLTYYNDYVGYYLILLIIAVWIYRHPLSKFQYLSLGCIIVVAASVKYTAFFYCGLTVLAIMLWEALHKKYSAAFKLGCFSLITALVSVFLLCYHPYVTNYLLAGHPCYPLMGDNPLDIMTGNTPEIYFHHNRFVNFFISIFSISHPSYAPRFGGFGWFFGVILILAVGALVTGYLKKRINIVYIYSATVALISCFIFPQTWWARYIPFLWLVPSIAMLAIINRKGIWRYCYITVISLGILSGMIFLANQAKEDTQLSLSRHYLKKIVQDGVVGFNTDLLYNDNGEINSKGVLSVGRRLDELGIRHYNSGIDPLNEGIRINVGGGLNVYINSSYLPKVESMYNYPLLDKVFKTNMMYSVYP